MSIKALITTLAIVGSSTAAMAQPTASFSASASWSYGRQPSAPVVRDHREYRGYRTQPQPIVYAPPSPTSHPTWVTEQPCEKMLLDGLTFNAGEYRKDVLVLGKGRFNDVIVQGEGGQTFVNKVVIEFTGGSVQVIPVDKYLSGSQKLTFDLDGNNRAINRIFVYRADGGAEVTQRPDVQRASRGEFSVLAA